MLHLAFARDLLISVLAGLYVVLSAMAAGFCLGSTGRFTDWDFVVTLAWPVLLPLQAAIDAASKLHG